MNVPVSYSWVTPNIQNNFISGYGYHRVCTWSVCPRYKQRFNSIELLENDIVFLNLDYFELFVNYLITNVPKNKFILVTQNSDRDFNNDMFQYIDNFTTKIFAINCTFSNPKVSKIPLGFNDQSTEILDQEDFTFVEKSNLIYMNFKLHHHSDRLICFNHFINFDWVDVENGILSLKDFYDKLKTYKYCISPRGTGIDTHRIYECLLYGVIPVVTKSPLDDLYKDLPILLVDRWEDVNYEFLIDSYQNKISEYFIWKEKNPDWFKSKKWIKQ